MNCIVLCLHQERGRSLIGRMNVGIQRVVLVREGKIAGIDDGRKVGAATKLVCRVQRIVKSLVKVCAQGGGKMRARGEAQDSDAVWINVPLAGVGAYDAESTLSIL